MWQLYPWLKVTEEKEGCFSSLMEKGFPSPQGKYVAGIQRLGQVYGGKDFEPAYIPGCLISLAPLPLALII